MRCCVCVSWLFTNDDERRSSIKYNDKSEIIWFHLSGCALRVYDTSHRCEWMEVCLCECGSMHVLNFIVSRIYVVRDHFSVAYQRIFCNIKMLNSISTAILIQNQYFFLFHFFLSLSLSRALMTPLLLLLPLVRRLRSCRKSREILPVPIRIGDSRCSVVFNVGDWTLGHSKATIKIGQKNAIIEHHRWNDNTKWILRWYIGNWCRYWYGNIDAGAKCVTKRGEFLLHFIFCSRWVFCWSILRQFFPLGFFHCSIRL